MEIWVEKITENEDDDGPQKDGKVPEDQAECDGVEQEGCGKCPARNAGVGEEGQDEERGEQEGYPDGLRPFEGQEGEWQEGEQGVGWVAEGHQILARFSKPTVDGELVGGFYLGGVGAEMVNE